MKDLGAEHLAGDEGVQLLGLLSFYLEQEQRFQPQEKGLSLIEATPENDNTLCSRLRNAKVKDLKS
jgi:cyclin G2